MGWLIALAVIAGLAVLPLGISAKYGNDGPLVQLIAGPVRVTLYPGKKKRKKPEKTAPKEQKKAQGQAGDKKGGALSDFLPLVRVILDFLVDFRRKLRVEMLELQLTLAGDDPCDLAVNYGRAWAALEGLMPQLERFFIIKKKDMHIACDFTAEKTVAYARLDLTITLGRLLCIAATHGSRVLREFLRIVKLRKGGALQ